MAKKPFTPIPPMAELPPAEEINVSEILDKYLSGEIDLICVLGPTASGKTRYAVNLARQINALVERPAAEIISADSRQVYRGMDIGTGKDLNEYEEIPYHLMDIVDAGTKYNIFEYQRDFEKAYKDIVDRGGIPILCGGSGLYIEAATCGYSLPEVPPDPELRAELEKKSDEELIAQLASLKPLHNNTDYDTRKRLIRALEVYYETGETITQHNLKTQQIPPRYQPVWFALEDTDRQELYNRIDRRVETMLECGLLEEIQGLLAMGIPEKCTAMQAIGYKEFIDALNGMGTISEAADLVRQSSRRYAKRQLTWFRRNSQMHWLMRDSATTTEEILFNARQVLHNSDN